MVNVLIVSLVIALSFLTGCLLGEHFAERQRRRFELADQELKETEEL